MKKIFSKFNRENKKRFQIETSLCIDDGKKFAIKKPLTVEAEEHIKNIYSNYLLLKENFKNNKNVDVVEAKLVENTLIFEYAEGEGLNKLISETIFKKNKKMFFELLQRYEKFVKSLAPIYKSTFVVNTELQKIFGNLQLENVDCFDVYNIDLILDNIFLNNDKYILIDYEWVFEHTMPVNYVIFRTICNMFFKYSNLLKNFVTREELYDFFKIPIVEQELYSKMETNFLKYILGNDYVNVIKDQYKKSQHSLGDPLRFKKQSKLKQFLQYPRLFIKKRNEKKKLKKRFG